MWSFMEMKTYDYLAFLFYKTGQNTTTYALHFLTLAGLSNPYLNCVLNRPSSQPVQSVHHTILWHRSDRKKNIELHQ